MRLDSANRSFAALVISSLLLGVYVLCGAVGCVLVPLIVSRVSHHGVDGLVGEGHNLLPAVLFVVLAGGGIILGARSLWRQVAASRILDRRVGALAAVLPGELARAATAAGLTGRVVLGDSPEWFSVAYGALRPRGAAIGGPELLEVRVAQLESGREPRVAVLNPTMVTLSVLGALLFTGTFIASIVGFGGASAVSQATGMGMSVGDVLGGVLCVVPFVLGALGIYRWIAWRARAPLTSHTSATTLS